MSLARFSVLGSASDAGKGKKSSRASAVAARDRAVFQRQFEDVLTKAGVPPGVGKLHMVNQLMTSWGANPGLAFASATVLTTVTADLLAASARDRLPIACRHVACAMHGERFTSGVAAAVVVHELAEAHPQCASVGASCMCCLRVKAVQLKALELVKLSAAASGGATSGSAASPAAGK